MKSNIRRPEVDDRVQDDGTERCDVLVVGAGPAGLTAAIALARNGVDVLVIERHSGTSPFPKATGVSTRTMEIFRSWGIEDEIRAGAIAVDPVVTVGETLVGPSWVTVPFGYPTDAEALEVSPTTPCCCPQDHLEPVLARHLRAQGGLLRFGEQVVGLVQDADEVLVTTLEAATGRTGRIRAQYVIGADGPRSFVRSAVGIEVDELGRLGDFMAVTFRADLTRRLQGRPGAVNTVEVRGAEGVFVPTGAGDRWVYAREWFPGAQPVQDWSTARCIELIRAASGVPDLEPEILSVMPFVMGGHVARAFRSGRVLLVGDAVHRTTPVGGTGMNTAIHAAHNLGWKLAWVLRGWAGEPLLDTYEAERRPIGTQNVVRSLQRGPAGPGTDGEGGDAAGAAGLNGLSRDVGVRYPTVGGDADDDPVGARAPHAWVRHQGRRVSTLDLFDGRMTLLTGACGERWRRCLDRLVDPGVPVAAVTVRSPETTGPDTVGVEAVGAHEIVDIDGAFARMLGLDKAVLVRPDGYVAWRSSGRDESSGRHGWAAALHVALDRVRGWDRVLDALPIAG
jgi:putative polyketide hydroxylase